MIDQVLNKINNLTDEQFLQLITKSVPTSWEYVGSMGKDDGDGAQWVRLESSSVVFISSTTYGDNDEYFLAKETYIDLDVIKNLGKSVIDFADCIDSSHSNLTDEDLSEILRNICLSVDSHGCNDTEIISNYNMSEGNDDFLDKKQEYINKAFSDVANMRDIPFQI